MTHENGAEEKQIQSKKLVINTHVIKIKAPKRKKWINIAYSILQILRLTYSIPTRAKYPIIHDSKSH